MAETTTKRYAYVLLQHDLMDGTGILFEESELVVKVAYWTPDDHEYKWVEFRKQLPRDAIVQRFVVAREGETE